MASNAQQPAVSIVGMEAALGPVSPGQYATSHRWANDPAVIRNWAFLPRPRSLACTVTNFEEGLGSSAMTVNEESGVSLPYQGIHRGNRYSQRTRDSLLDFPCTGMPERSKCFTATAEEPGTVGGSGERSVRHLRTRVVASDRVHWTDSHRSCESHR